MSTEITYQYGTVGVLKNKVVDFKRDLFYEVLKIRKNLAIKPIIIRNLYNKYKNYKKFEKYLYESKKF